MREREAALQLLGLSGSELSRPALRKAYRAAVLAHHPDKNPGDAGAASRFRAACDAYSILDESLGVSDDDLSLAARRGTASFEELNRLFERMAACQAKVDSLRGEIDSLQLEVDEIADAAQKAMAPARGDPRARRAA